MAAQDELSKFLSALLAIIISLKNATAVVRDTFSKPFYPAYQMRCFSSDDKSRLSEKLAPESDLVCPLKPLA